MFRWIISALTRVYWLWLHIEINWTLFSQRSRDRNRSSLSPSGLEKQKVRRVHIVVIPPREEQKIYENLHIYIIHIGWGPKNNQNPEPSEKPYRNTSRMLGTLWKHLRNPLRNPLEELQSIMCWTQHRHTLFRRLNFYGSFQSQN